MPRKIISIYRKRKRKSHSHSKNASRLKTSKQYKKPYRGQGR